jgi:hypothetical protein
MIVRDASSEAELHILFPTGLSDSCLQAGRAIAQLAETCRIHLVIVHVVPPGGATVAVRRALDAFLPEADQLDACRRVILESDDTAQTVADYAQRGFDLIVSPASDRLGLRGLVAPSFRGRLMRRTAVPLWSIGGSVCRTRFQRRIKNVAYLVDYHHDAEALPLISSFANRFDADLHVLDVIPEITEGTVVLDAERPLSAELSAARIRTWFEPPRLPNVMTVIGTRRARLRRLIERCDADVLFVGQEQAAPGLLFSRFARDLDRLPCPVICLGSAAEPFAGWSYERGHPSRYDRERDERVPAGWPVSRGPRPAVAGHP